MPPWSVNETDSNEIFIVISCILTTPAPFIFDAGSLLVSTMSCKEIYMTLMCNFWRIFHLRWCIVVVFPLKTAAGSVIRLAKRARQCMVLKTSSRGLYNIYLPISCIGIYIYLLQPCNLHIICNLSY